MNTGLRPQSIKTNQGYQMARPWHELEITVHDMIMKVEFSYDPAAPATADSMGEEENIDIITVEHCGVMINNFIDNLDLWGVLDNAVSEAIHKNRLER